MGTPFTEIYYYNLWTPKLQLIVSELADLNELMQCPNKTVAKQ